MRFEVASELGRGSVFTIRLAAAQARRRLAVTSTNAARILVVDDDLDTCRNLSDILSDLGYDVDCAQGGPAALELVAQRLL